MEKDIMECELKMLIPDDVPFNKLYCYFNDRYDMCPYDRSVVCDIYYDTGDLHLYNNDCCFRLRQKRNSSMNFKTKGIKYKGIWSRREYRDKVRKKDVSKDILDIHTTAVTALRNYLTTDNLDNFSNTCTILSRRTSYLLKSKCVDETGKADVFGVCIFDTFTDFDFPVKQYKELEIEICNSLITPYIFDELINIGKELCLKYLLRESEFSKYKIIMKDKLMSYLM